MKHIFAIITGLLITILFVILRILSTSYLLQLGVHGYNVDLLFVITVFFLCGGLVTWLSTENKIRYSLYYSIVFDCILFAIIFAFYFWNFRLLVFLILIPISAGIGGVIAKNEKNNIKKIIKNKFKGNYQRFFIGLYKRNKKALIVSLTTFIVSVLIGGIGPLFSSQFNQFMITVVHNYFLGLSSFKLTTASLFLNNSAYAVLYLYIGGLFFGFISIISLVKTGLIIGFLIAKNPIYQFFYLLPHGIIEISAYVIAVAAGLKLLSAALNIIWGGLHIKRNISLSEQVNKILSLNYLKFRDSLILMCIAIILLFIAAIIEANITIPFTKYMMSII